jgi:membrane-associated protease RseP (regulator of RpoE activity)
MSSILAILMLALGAAVHFGALFAARWGFRRALDGKVKESSVPFMAARGVAGVMGWYLAASIVFTIATIAGGRIVVDDTSMRVHVAPDGPAARAGVRDGDRIVSAGGVPIQTWDELKRTVGTNGSEPLTLQIDRGGQAIEITATPDGSPPRLQVAPWSGTESAGVGSAIAEGLVTPAKVVANTLRGLVRMLTASEQPELSGPVGIVRETSATARVGLSTTLKFVALLASYFLIYVVPGSALFEVLDRRRTTKRDARAGAVRRAKGRSGSDP